MLKQCVAQICFDFFSRLPIVVEPHEVQVSSDTGILPIRQFDDQIGLTDRLVACLNDARDPDHTEHSLPEMARQRIFGILAGYEDCNDHDMLRSDPVFKMVSGRTPNGRDLASQPTLSRFENAVDIPSLWRLHDFFIDDFISSFDTPPASLTLDLDATDDSCHGEQQLALFHGFYDQYQYYPLIISCDETKQILWPALRPGTVHAALGADDDLEYVVNRLRQAWPDVVIYVRADTGFGIPWMYDVCERLELPYTLGLSTNQVLKRATENLVKQAVERFEQTGEPQQLFDRFFYRAKSWKNHRLVIAKAECNHLGTNLRFVVTNRPGAATLPEVCYDNHVQRGESENRNKELKCGLQADRLSDHRYFANLFRLYLHTIAYNLLILMRHRVIDPPKEADSEEVPTEALAGRRRRQWHNRRREHDPLGEGQPCTWRTRLIKVGARVLETTRRVIVQLSSSWPYLNHYRQVSRQVLATGRASFDTS